MGNFIGTFSVASLFNWLIHHHKKARHTPSAVSIITTAGPRNKTSSNIPYIKNRSFFTTFSLPIQYRYCSLGYRPIPILVWYDITVYNVIYLKVFKTWISLGRMFIVSMFCARKLVNDKFYTQLRCLFSHCNKKYCLTGHDWHYFDSFLLS